MKRLTVVLLAMGLAVSGCSNMGQDFDPEAFEEIIETLEEMEANNNPDASTNGGSDQDSTGNDTSGNEPAHTDSPNRPPSLDGGDQLQSEYSVGAGRSVEEYEYSPLDASADDIVDHYDDAFGDSAERTEGQNSDGAWTRWQNDEQLVVVVDTGLNTNVMVQYDD